MSTDGADSNTSQFIIYQSEDGQTRLDVRFVDESVWLTQALRRNCSAPRQRTC